MQNALYCPRCGKQFTDKAVYCRTCGLPLAGVSEIVNGEADSAPVVTRRPNFKLFQIGFALFIVGLAIGLINGALRDFDLFPQSYGKLVFMLLVAAGFLMLGAGFLFPTKKYSKPNPSELRDPSKAQLSESKQAVSDMAFAMDTQELEPIGSVTENTTRNLGQTG